MYKLFYDAIDCHQVTYDIAYDIATFLLSGSASEIEIASLLTALNFYGVTPELIAGFAQAMKDQCTPMIDNDFKLIDVCGTGGDGHHTFNISTTVSLLIASELKVAKHGNRSVSSKSGSADVIKALKLPISEHPNDIHNSLSNDNYRFIFAPDVHKNMKHVMPIRTKLKIPTIFNIIGPLCNPYSLNYQVVGVYKKSLMYPMAQALIKLGVDHAAVVYGHNGLDELSLTGVNTVLYVRNQTIVESTIDPKDFGIPYAELDEIIGGDAESNAKTTIEILSGQHSPKLDIVALNAGLALFIGDVRPNLEESIQLAYKLLESKVGLHLYNRIRSAS